MRNLRVSEALSQCQCLGSIGYKRLLILGFVNRRDVNAVIVVVLGRIMQDVSRILSRGRAYGCDLQTFECVTKVVGNVFAISQGIRHYMFVDRHG